jgi:hypothetical protein
MFNRFIILLFVQCLFCFNASAKNSNNPFAKNESLNIGKDIKWSIDKNSVTATKTANDNKGNYYHLQFDNVRLKLLISKDASASMPKSFSQLEI